MGGSSDGTDRKDLGDAKHSKETRGSQEVGWLRENWVWRTAWILRKASRDGGSWNRNPDANLVKGPLLMRVLCKLVNEGVELLWDDHAVGGDEASTYWDRVSCHL